MGLTGPGMLSRRDFINGTIGAGVLLAAQGARTAKAQMNTRKRTIVDAQVHLWKAKSGDTVRFPDASNSNMDGTIFPRARAEFVVSDAIARTACVVSLVGKRHGVEGRT